MRRSVGAGVVLALWGAAASVAAQQPATGDLFHVYVNGGLQAGSHALTDRFGYRVYGEDAEFTVTHAIPGGALFDAGASLRIWRNLSLGAGFTLVESTDATMVAGTVPHPLQFDNPRTLPAQSLALDHREQAGHIFASWRIPLAERLDVSVFGGGSFFNVTQGVVTNVTAVEAGGPPFAAVGLDQLQQGEYRRNGVGGHGGVDIAYLLTPAIGVGVTVRFTRGSVEIPSARSDPRSLTVGGLQVGGGLRLRF